MKGRRASTSDYQNNGRRETREPWGDDAEEVGEDEVEAFWRARHARPTAGVGRERVADDEWDRRLNARRPVLEVGEESDDEQDEEWGSERFQGHSESGSDGSDSSASDEGSASEEDELWDGRDRSLYYDADTAGDADEVPDVGSTLAEEEREARRLQRRQMERIAVDDFTGGPQLQPSTPTATGEREETSPEKGMNGKEASTVTAEMFATPDSAQIDADAPTVVQTLDALTRALQEVTAKADGLPSASDAPTTDHPGGSLGELKRTLLLHYCTHLAYYLVLKAEGRSVREHPVIDHLIEIGLTLEKLRPLEERARPQLLALRKAAAQAERDGVMEQAAANGKARPAERSTKSAEPPTDSDDEETPEGVTAVSRLPPRADIPRKPDADTLAYVPPQVHPDAFESERQRARREHREVRHRAHLRAALEVDAWMDELHGRPERLGRDGTAALTESDRRRYRQAQERQAYEEEHMLRLPERKADRAARRRLEAAAGGGSDGAHEWHSLLSIADRIAQQSREGSKRDEQKRGREEESEAYVREKQRQLLRKRQQQQQQQQQREQGPEAASTKRRPPEWTERDASSEEEMQRENARGSEHRSKRTRDHHASTSTSPAPPPPLYTYDDTLSDGERRRRASSQILRNRGLAPRRRPDAAHRNPRVRRRAQYAKAVKRRRGQVRTFDAHRRAAAAGGAYTGETSGINKSTRHSTSLRQRV
ncbi:hypothetical protein CDCA_CDCA02G0656 [Cyanidium caldarium]|uniref:Sas10 C-terminal domain-containing protein n=1 Tax=Cyanidium caldarium TaxID=2771 RepID=A0AAV9IRC5_CYACA|nr:hypothetical protein CDCA_CDCA02G0656 [Cyanidium caldarium]